MSYVDADLRRLIKLTGGTRQLARALGVSSRSVQRWQALGVPERGNARSLIAAYKEQLARDAELRAFERQTFEALMHEAGELGRLPQTRSRTKRRDGPRTEGWDYTLSIERMVSRLLISKIEVWARKIKTRLPVWQGQLVSTQYALPGSPSDPVKEFRGYQTIGSIEQMSNPASGDFAVGLISATKRARTKRQALKVIEAALEELVDDAELMVWVHSFTLANYKLRSEQERKQWESKKRAERKAKLERRRKRGEAPPKPRRDMAAPSTTQWPATSPKKVKKGKKQRAKKTAALRGERRNFGGLRPQQSKRSKLSKRSKPAKSQRKKQAKSQPKKRTKAKKRS